MSECAMCGTGCCGCAPELRRATVDEACADRDRMGWALEQAQAERDAARAELADANRYAESLRRALDLVLDALLRMPGGSLGMLDTAAIEEAKRVLAGGL